MEAAERTHVGIVEWAQRARGAELTGRALAHMLGRAVSTTDRPEVRGALLDRARRHGWCADQWSTVIPVLHDIDLSAVVPIDAPALRTALDDPDGPADAERALATEALATDALSTIWARWAAEAGSVADAPFAFVLERTLHELVPGAPR
ncbi:MAG TPA: hypothetical protein VFZ17_10510 [Acidimicrobiia bacterium]|nr:hypothetical protein [Acidimicrobiia bacterium]